MINTGSNLSASELWAAKTAKGMLRKLWQEQKNLHDCAGYLEQKFFCDRKLAIRLVAYLEDAGYISKADQNGDREFR